MTDYTDLIERLLRISDFVYGDDLENAADALKAQARRISELEKMLAVHRLAVDVDALKARIAELEAENKKLRDMDSWNAKYRAARAAYLGEKE